MELWPCLIRPKPDLDFKIRILKPWGCKQTECWIRIRFLENKCKIWIYFLSRCHYLSILSERILSKCHCVVSLTFYCEIVDYEMIKQIVWSFHQTLAHLVSWFHESGFGFRKSGLNKRNGFWNQFQFWSNQTGPILKAEKSKIIGNGILATRARFTKPVSGIGGWWDSCLTQFHKHYFRPTFTAAVDEHVVTMVWTLVCT